MLAKLSVFHATGRKGTLKTILHEVEKLRRISIKPKTQGLGIGELLLKKVLDEAKIFWAKGFYLYSFLPLVLSHKIY